MHIRWNDKKIREDAGYRLALARQLAYEMGKYLDEARPGWWFHADEIATTDPTLSEALRGEATHRMREALRQRTEVEPEPGPNVRRRIRAYVPDNVVHMTSENKGDEPA